MASDTAPCQKCRSEIDPDAEVCPDCGYDPQAKGRTMRKVFLVGGWFLTISIIGSPIGIPMLLTYYIADRKVSQKRPTTH